MASRVTRKRALLFTIKLVISGGLVTLALKDVDFAEAARLAGQLHPAAILLALLVMLMEATAGAVRWWVNLRQLGTPLPMRACMPVYLLGGFFNQALPSTVGGDAVRIWQGRALGLPLDAATKSVILDRLAGFLTLLLFASVSTIFAWPLMGDVENRWVLPAALGGGLLGFALFIAAAARLSERAQRGAGGHFSRFALDARRLFLSPKRATRVMGLSLLLQVSLVLVVFILARGIGTDLSLAYAFALIPPVLSASTMPVSIAGWGVREVGMVAALGLVGVPGERAVVVSILFGLLLVLWGCLGGLFWLLVGRRLARHLTVVPAGAEQTPAPPDQASEHHAA